MLCCWLRCADSELVELADFSIDLDLFHDGRIAGSDGLDLGVGEGSAFEVLGRADGGLAAHDLLNKPGLGFQRLPHIGVERAFRDVAVDLDFGIEVSLPQNAAFALFDIAGPPGRIQMMERLEAALDVRARAHLFRGADQDSHAPGIHIGEQRHLGGIGIGVVDEGDFPFGNAARDEPGAEIVIDVEAVLGGRREIAEDELC